MKEKTNIQHEEKIRDILIEYVDSAIIDENTSIKFTDRGTIMIQMNINGDLKKSLSNYRQLTTKITQRLKKFRYHLQNYLTGWKFDIDDSIIQVELVYKNGPK